MAEETKPTPPTPVVATPPTPAVVPTPPPPKEQPLNWALVSQHLAKYKETIMSYAGKNGMNPYIWLSRRVNMDKLEKAVVDPAQQTKELYNQVMKLSLHDKPEVSLLGDDINLPIIIPPAERRK